MNDIDRQFSIFQFYHTVTITRLLSVLWLSIYLRFNAVFGDWKQKKDPNLCKNCDSTSRTTLCTAAERFWILKSLAVVSSV